MPKNYFLYPAILFLAMLLVNPLVHEAGHVFAAKSKNICFAIQKVNFFDGSGLSVPCTNDDCVKYNMLSKGDKEVITHAGVTVQVSVFVLLGMVLSVLAFFFVKARDWDMALWLSLLIVLCVAIVGTSIYYNAYMLIPGNDWAAGSLSCGG